MAYGLTYAPPLHPGTPAGISADLFDRWLPQISARLAASGGPFAYHYGNVPGAFGEEADAPRGWYSYSGQIRYSSNYVGMRGRYGILSESYSYDPFETRVRSSRRFAEEVVEQTWREATHVRRATEAADRATVTGQDVAVRSTFEALPAPAEVLLGRVDTLANPVSGAPMLRNTGDVIRETMPVYNRFRASETTRAPQSLRRDVRAVAGGRPRAARPRTASRTRSDSSGARPARASALTASGRRRGRARTRPAPRRSGGGCRSRPKPATRRASPPRSSSRRPARSAASPSCSSTRAPTTASSRGASSRPTPSRRATSRPIQRLP